MFFRLAVHSQGSYGSCYIQVSLGVKGARLGVLVDLDSSSFAGLAVREGTLPAAFRRRGGEPKTEKVTAGVGRRVVDVGSSGVEDVA